MIRAIDHIVILVEDLAQASADYTALGFTVVPGGEHTGGATHNALVVFADDTYLELIAFKRPAPEHRWWRHAAQGGGIIDFALLPTAIEDDIAAAQQRGLTLLGPTAGGRQRPDGRAVAWQSGQATTPDLPFLCGDVTARSLRVPEGALRQHPNGVSGIAELVVAVADLGVSTARYRALLGVAEHEVAPSQLDAPAAHTVSFALGHTALTLAAPGGSGDALAQRLAARGEGPFELRLYGSQPGLLDTARSQGARIRIGAAEQS